MTMYLESENSYDMVYNAEKTTTITNPEKEPYL